MKLVKNRKFAQRGNLLMQSAVALLIGALSVAGVIYFLGYIQSAKINSAVEQIQGLYIATIHENASDTKSKDVNSFIASNGNNFSPNDFDSVSGNFSFATGDTVNILCINNSPVDCSSIQFGSMSAPTDSFASVLTRATAAGYIDTSYCTPENCPTTGTSPLIGLVAPITFKLNSAKDGYQVIDGAGTVKNIGNYQIWITGQGKNNQ